MNTDPKTKTHWEKNEYGFWYQIDPIIMDYSNYEYHMTKEMAYLRLGFILSRFMNLILKTRFLDYGCGNRIFIDVLEKLGYSIKGYDCNYEYSDLLHHGAFSQVWDIITMYDVLEHFLDFSQFFAFIYFL